MPLASIVIPTRDRLDYLAEAVESALAQTVGEIEVIVVDDGSSVPISASAYDGRVRVIRHEHPRGVSAARNAGLWAATGEHVCFLDDDDRLAPAHIAAALDTIGASSMATPVAATSGVRSVDDAGSRLGERAAMPVERGARFEPPCTWRCRQLNHMSLVAPRSVLDRVGGFDERLRSHEHGDFFYRLTRVCSVAVVGDASYVQREHDGPRATTDWRAMAAADEYLSHKHRISMARRTRGEVLSRAAYLYRKAGDRVAERRCAVRGALLCPSARGLRIVVGTFTDRMLVGSRRRDRRG